MDCTICSHVMCNLRLLKSIVFGTEYIAGLLDNVVRFEQHRHTGSYLQSLLPHLHLRWKPRMLSPVQLVFSMLNYFSAGKEAGFVFWLNTFVSLFLPAVFHLSCLSKDRVYFVLSLFSLFSLSFSSFLSHLEFGQKCEICSDFKKMVKVSDFGQNWTLIKNLTLENKYVI